MSGGTKKRDTPVSRDAVMVNDEIAARYDAVAPADQARILRFRDFTEKLRQRFSNYSQHHGTSEQVSFLRWRFPASSRDR